jgi:hypothetical protein
MMRRLPLPVISEWLSRFNRVPERWVRLRALRLVQERRIERSLALGPGAATNLRKIDG